MFYIINVPIVYNIKATFCKVMFYIDKVQIVYNITATFWKEMFYINKQIVHKITAYFTQIQRNVFLLKQFLIKHGTT